MLVVFLSEDDRPLSPVAACSTAWKVLSDQSSMESSFNESATGRVVRDKFMCYKFSNRGAYRIEPPPHFVKLFEWKFLT